MAEDSPRVGTHSGFAYAERPACFVWLGAEYTVRDVASAWLEPGQRHFLVETDDGRRFHLVYDEAEDRWHVSSAK